MSWVHGHVIGRVEYADGWDGWHELFASFNTSERCIVVQWSHSAVFSDEILYALVNNSCLREGVAALHDAMTDGVDVVEVVNNGEVTSGECVDNECNGLLVVVSLNILFDLFAFCLDFEAGVAAIPMRSTRPLDITSPLSMSMSWNFREELPLFITNTIIFFFHLIEI